MSESALLSRWVELAQQRSANVALRDADGEVSFESIHSSALRLARRLAHRGLAGRRIALLVPASRGWVSAFWGILLAGAEVVPLAELHPDAEHLRALRASRAAALIHGGGLGAGLTTSEPQHDAIPLEITELLVEEEPASAASLPLVSGDATAVVFFTSGTTGAPKAARLSHDQLAHMARMVGDAWGVEARDRLVHCLPLHHMHGLGIAYLVCQQAGATVHLLGHFSPRTVWEELEHGSIFMAVPTIHKKLIDEFYRASAGDQARWRTYARALRLVTSGSAALPSALAEGWAELGGSIPLERFGMTEVGVALTNPLRRQRVIGSAGQPLSGMQIRIVDEHGRDVATGASGEIWIRGPSVFTGYDDPDQTRAAFSSDGWFKSGDTAVWLADGFVKILGRTSVDIIKSGGYKLSALEIEDALRAHPLVDDVAVVGVHDLTWGERVVAAVVTSGPVSEVELRAFLKPRLAPYKIPKQVVSLDGLPRNVMGKVDKRKVQAYVATRLGGEGP